MQGEILPVIGLTNGTWYSVGEAESDKTWSGNVAGIGFSIVSPNLKSIWQNLTKVGAGEVQTRTELIYPKMSSKTATILNSYYDRP
ncbi:MAG TPA: hypothetical protein VMV56_03625 [Williamwhitmania sp.]|nr:hypothetical protein [Williamwhitmania sp.]